MKTSDSARASAVSSSPLPLPRQPLQQILIDWSAQETRVALVEDDTLQELHIERSSARGLVGNVYLGKVARILPGLQSAFIDIGLERAAFLHVADLIASPRDDGPGAGRGADRAPAPIEKRVFEGQSLMVQVSKDALGSKGARVTMQISLAGRLLVMLPHERELGVSQKIPMREREALRSRLAALVGACASGFILRTNAEDATDAELAQDIAYLRRVWAQVQDSALHLPAKSLLHRDLSLLERVLRDLVDEATHSIQIDSLVQFDRLRAFGREFTPAAVDRLVHYQGVRPIFDRYAIDDEIAKALARRVELKSGGYLVIDQTEALTTIDVNTGGFVGSRNFDDTVLRTNLDAAQAIVRQLRLRNLGGIVIVDFIDMTHAGHADAVLAELRRQLARDRVTTTVGGFSQLGLVELTRKRTRESLAQLLCEPCAVCAGAGHVKTARTVAYDILRELRRDARPLDLRQVRIVASPAVIEQLRGEESPHLAALSDFIGKPISLSCEAARGSEQYDIVLL